MKQAANQKLMLRTALNDQLNAYVEASWDGEPQTERRSRSLLSIKYESAPIFVTSDLQKFA